MSPNVKIKIIEQIYEAFGRRDPRRHHHDVGWAAETTSAAAPWYGVRHGKDAVAEFLTAFGPAMEIEEFTPASLAANDPDVLAVVRCRARSRSTGKTIAMDLHHCFRFRDGKIAYYRGTEDTAQTEAALRD